MRINFTLLLLLSCQFVSSFAQTSKDYAVLIRATVVENPASITLSWNADTTCVSHIVYRKSKDAISWGSPLASLSKSVTQYTDNTVVAGKTYEYYIRRTYSQANRFAHGYVYAGIKVPEQPDRGGLLLLVDKNYVQPLAIEIDQLIRDLSADGWLVKRYDIDRSASVSSVKSIIASEYSNTSFNTLYLLGRIPVPYSGGFKAEAGSDYPPDGHTDHGGAWPADLYYGSLNEDIWTDSWIDDSSPARAENQNVPSDGKFDLDYFYGSDSIMFGIGRVDLTNMPEFGSSDTLLVKDYLVKAHKYKTGQVNVVRRGLIDDNFGAMNGEAFASTAWRDFSVMFGDSVFERDYISSVKQGNYLFAYGCGGGWYSGASGIGSTSDFHNDSIQTIFTSTFGSYFGDWDSQNNFLRAPLCSKPSALTNVWSGRPYWMFHHMALGENIGYCARITQNNYSLFNGSIRSGYAYNFAPTYIHIALMGDPSLRLHALKPVEKVRVIRVDSAKFAITWSKQPEADHYLVLRSASLFGKYQVISSVPSASDSFYLDEQPNLGYNYYMVRPVVLEQTPSGTYYNMALGVLDSGVTFRATGIQKQEPLNQNMIVYPNPNNGVFTVMYGENKDAEVECYDMTGKLLLKQSLSLSSNTVNLSAYGTGVYLIKVKSGENEKVTKVVVY